MVSRIDDRQSADARIDIQSVGYFTDELIYDLWTVPLDIGRCDDQLPRQASFAEPHCRGYRQSSGHKRRHKPAPNVYVAVYQCRPIHESIPVPRLVTDSTISLA